MRQCKNCKYFTLGQTDAQHKAWSKTNWGMWSDGVCNLYFPRGYIGRKPPHPAHSTGGCFQFEERTYEQMEMEAKAHDER